MGARTRAAVQRRSFPSLTIVLAAAVAGVDLLSKWVVTERLGPGTGTGSWWLPGGWLGFDYGRNTGAAFGMFAGNPALLAALSVVIAAGICWLIWVEVSSFRLRVLCSGLIVGGAGGNFIERVRQGFVTDFVAVGPWPRFNVSDSAVCVGVVLMVLAVVFQSGRSTSRDVAAGVADSRRPFPRNTVEK